MEEFRQRLVQQYGDAAAFETAYGVTGDADIVRATMEAARDTTFSSHMRNWARATTAAGSRAYLYFFTHTPPSPRAAEMKAFHAGEIPYVFNVVPSNDPREADFAYTEPYDLATEPYLEVGPTIKSGRHLLKTQLDFLEEALSRSRAR